MKHNSLNYKWDLGRGKSLLQLKNLNKENKKVRLTANILFSGIGCQERGFQDSGLFDLEVLNTSDINKEAVLSYAAIHCGLTNEMVETYPEYPSREEMAQHLTDINLGYNPKKGKYFDWFKLAKRKSNDIERYWLACKLTNNLGDISKIKDLPYADFWTVSFCCQDISIAGKMKGLKPGSKTRSSLLWENIRLLKTAKENNSLPKYIMFENVKNLVSKRFIDDFNSLLEVLSELGFNSYWSVINGKNCGIPQNRERVFVISIRKDIDTGKYTFPKPFDNGVRLRDVLEDTVEEKYYLSEDVQKRFKSTDKTFTKNVVGTTAPTFRTIGQRDRVYQKDGIMANLNSSDYKQPKQNLLGLDKPVNDTKIIEYANCVTAREDSGVPSRKSEGTAVLEQVGQLYGTEKEPNPQAGRVYNKDNLSPTLDTCGGGNRMPKIIEEKISHSEWKQEMYRKFIEDSEGEVCGVITNQSQTFGYRPPMKGFSKCLRAEANDTGVMENFRIRKLTPRECYKLMGLTFDDCDKAKAIGVADTHLYKQAGNGIITNCCELLAEHLYKAQYDDTYVCTDENFTKPQTE